MNELATRLQSVIDTAIDGIIIIDSKGTVEDINQSALRLFGYDKSEVTGKNVKMLMPAKYEQHHDQYISGYIKTRTPKIIGIGREVQGKTKLGNVFPFQLAVSEVILHDRVVFTGIIHDLTALNKSKRELEELNVGLEEKVEKRTRELEKVVNQLLKTNTKLEEKERHLTESLEKEKELNNLKSRFVSMASHEFRTPLTTILSSASLISKYNTADQQDKRMRHIDKIKSSVENLTGILNDFLSLSKIEEGKVSLNLGKCDVNQLVNDTLDDLKPILKRGISIKTNLVGDLVLNSDKHLLKNILFNLLSNAIKYSLPDSEISLNIEVTEHIMVMDVIDNGIGIPEADQVYLFQRFHRATNVTNIKGTGLGLHIVKRYANMLSGDITFVSTENVGTTFTVTLPTQENKA